MLPFAEREVLRFRDTIESPPTRYLLYIQGPMEYTVLGVDFYVVDNDGCVTFHRADPDPYVEDPVVAVLSPRTAWSLIRREELHIMTHRRLAEIERDDRKDRAELARQLYPAEMAEAERTAQSLKQAGPEPTVAPNVAVLPEGHRGPWL